MFFHSCAAKQCRMALLRSRVTPTGTRVPNSESAFWVVLRSCASFLLIFVAPLFFVVLR